MKRRQALCIFIFLILGHEGRALASETCEKIFRIDPKRAAANAEYETRQIIRDDLTKMLASAKPVSVYRDKAISSLVRLDTMGNSKRTLPHEIRTAEDYAVFVGHRFGQDFAFVPEFRGKSVPVFDGAVLEKDTHAPKYNVSFKYIGTKVAEPDLASLISEMRTRILDHQRKVAEVSSLVAWFRATNNLRAHLVGVSFAPTYFERLKHAAALMRFFDLRPRDTTPERKTKLVIDMRDHGYSFEFFRDNEVQAQFVRLLEASAKPDLILLLLWDDRHVIEIDQRSVEFYE